MATTSGRVSSVYLQSEIACIYVEYAPRMEALFTIQFLREDTTFVLDQKRQLTKLIMIGFNSRRPVTITHDQGESLVLGVELVLQDISPVGPAVHGDLYSISGDGIHPAAQVVFDTATVEVTVAPDLRRPKWLLIEQPPSSIPPGPATVQLVAPGYASDAVPIMVSAGPAQARRTLYPGRASASPPYTFAFVATPGLEAATGGGVTADPVLTDRPGYNDTVRYCLANLLTVTEPLLRTESFEANIRFISIFDTTAAANTASALVHRVPASSMVEPVRGRMNAFAGRYWEDPDVVFALTANTTHTRASAWFTTDDNAKPGVGFTYDGNAFTHRRHTDIPGSAAISTSVDQTGLTSLHEFGHAASDFNNGKVIDLYNDGAWPGLVVNKKFRGVATSSVPAVFGTYDATSFNSDTARDGIGYPATWRSYHAAQLDTARPNLMDNYWLAATQVQACRLDGLTFEWFLDRLRAKILR